MEKTLENLVANRDATRQREKVIKFLIRNAANFGFQPLEVDDGGDIALEVGTEDEVLDVVFSVNCSTIRFTGHGRIHEVEVDLTQEPGEILVDSSSNPNWEACLKEVDKFCESLPTGRPALAAGDFKYYAISGRVPGDDEDQTISIGGCYDRETAIMCFTATLHDASDDDYVEMLIKEHGQAVFINAIVSSDTPIEVE